MTTAYTFTLDGYTFPRSDVPARGPIIYHQPQRWSRFHPIGHTGTDATLLTALGLESQEWTFTSRASSATKDKLIAVYEAQTDVTLTTPQDAGGVQVIMTSLEIAYEEPIEASKYLCTFTLVRR